MMMNDMNDALEQQQLLDTAFAHLRAAQRLNDEGRHTEADIEAQAYWAALERASAHFGLSWAKGSDGSHRPAAPPAIVDIIAEATHDNVLPSLSVFRKSMAAYRAKFGAEAV